MAVEVDTKDPDETTLKAETAVAPSSQPASTEAAPRPRKPDEDLAECTTKNGEKSARTPPKSLQTPLVGKERDGRGG